MPHAQTCPVCACPVPLEVWIVGKYQGSLDSGSVAWDCQGVFSSEEAAIDACKGAMWFIAPLTLDEVLPDEPTPWPDARYPNYPYNAVAGLTSNGSTAEQPPPPPTEQPKE